MARWPRGGQTAGRSASRLCVSQRWGTVADVPALIKDLLLVKGEKEQILRVLENLCQNATDAMAAISHGPVRRSANRSSMDANRLASRRCCPLSAPAT